MSAYKHLSDLCKICSVLPALAIMPAVAAVNNPAYVENWSGTTVEKTDESVPGGILNIAAGENVGNINAGTVENNKIVLTKTADKGTAEVFGQGAVIYSRGDIAAINGTFKNNSISNTSETATKATANGGAFALYAGTNIGEINGDFIGNSVSSTYSGDGTTEYTSGSQISAGGGAMHIEGQYGNSAVKIGTITGNFIGNSATGDGYANGGAIYIKGGADRAGQQGYGVSVDKIVGNFENNSVVAKTGTSANKKASTGGAISIKNAEKDVTGATVNIVGNFTNNSVTTNGTDALGGAIYNEGALTVSGDFINNIAKSETGAAWGGAINNTGDLVIKGGKMITDNSAGFGGAIWNEGNMTFDLEFDGDNRYIVFGNNQATAELGAGGAIYNKGTIDNLSHALFQYNSAFQGGAINNNISGVINNISASTFANNNAGWSAGGAIRNQGKIRTMSGLIFRENKSGNGGALWNGTAGSVVESLSDVDFIGNIAISDNEKAEQQGGAITNAGRINLISDADFTSNQAGVRGGAIANVAPQGESDNYIKLQDTTFTGNIAGQEGGAIWNNASGVIDFAGDNIFTDNVANGVGNDIHNLGTVNIVSGTTSINGGITGDGTLTIADGATLDIGTATIQQGTLNLDGTLAADLINEQAFGHIDVDNFNVGADGKLDLTFGSAGTYDFGGVIASDKITYKDGIYNVDVDGSNIIVSTKTVDEITESANLTTGAAIALVGLANSDNIAMNIASLNAQNALNNGDIEYIENESAKLLAEDKPVAQSVATSVQNQVLSLATSRMAGGAAMGRSGGDLADVEYGAWAQGLMNRTKYADKFNGDTNGIAVGADALIGGKYIIGIGYAYNTTDVNSSTRDTDITSNSLFLYGQYKPNKWYVNAALNYTMANYTEMTTAFGAMFNLEYDVDSFGGQVMTGYDFASGLTPEIGARYLHVSRDAYNNGLFDIASSDTDYLTGVAGLKYAFTIESQARLKFRPEIRAAATYDFMSDVAIANVSVPGAGSYVVTGERLSRLGGEFGIGLSALYEGMEISINYDLDLHEHYTSQTGMVKFRLDF